jgi:hypothetical protein
MKGRGQEAGGSEKVRERRRSMGRGGRGAERAHIVPRRRSEGSEAQSAQEREGGGLGADGEEEGPGAHRRGRKGVRAGGGGWGGVGEVPMICPVSPWPLKSSFSQFLTVSGLFQSFWHLPEHSLVYAFAGLFLDRIPAHPGFPAL